MIPLAVCPCGGKGIAAPPPDGPLTGPAPPPGVGGPAGEPPPVGVEGAAGEPPGFDASPGPE